jgi:membrane associated rhomboid family serine protease
LRVEGVGVNYGNGLYVEDGDPAIAYQFDVLYAKVDFPKLEALPDLFELVSLSRITSTPLAIIRGSKTMKTKEQEEEEITFWAVCQNGNNGPNPVGKINPKGCTYTSLPEDPEDHLPPLGKGKWMSGQGRRKQIDPALNVEVVRDRKWARVGGDIYSKPKKGKEKKRESSFAEYLLNCPANSFFVGVNMYLAFYIWSYRVNPMDIVSGYDLIVNDKQYYRIITASFAHLEILHLAFNMSTLYSLGRLEMAIGTLQYFVYTVDLVFLTMICMIGIHYVLIYYRGMEQYRHSKGVGFSCVLFAWMTVASLKMPTFTPIAFFPQLEFVTHHFDVPLPLVGVTSLPVNIGPFILLGFTSIIIPRASFIGHLSGILLGYPLAWGLLRWITPAVLVRLLTVCVVTNEALPSSHSVSPSALPAIILSFTATVLREANPVASSPPSVACLLVGSFFCPSSSGQGSYQTVPLSDPEGGRVQEQAQTLEEGTVPEGEIVPRPVPAGAFIEKQRYMQFVEKDFARILLLQCILVVVHAALFATNSTISASLTVLLGAWILFLFARMEYDVFNQENPDHRISKLGEERVLFVLLAGYLLAAMIDLLVALVNVGAIFAIEPLLAVALTKGGTAAAYDLDASNLYLGIEIFFVCVSAVSIKRAIVFLHGSAQGVAFLRVLDLDFAVGDIDGVFNAEEEEVVPFQV